MVLPSEAESNGWIVAQTKLRSLVIYNHCNSLEQVIISCAWSQNCERRHLVFGLEASVPDDRGWIVTSLLGLVSSAALQASPPSSALPPEKCSSAHPARLHTPLRPRPTHRTTGLAILHMCLDLHS